jgi:pyruvate kinase
MVREAAAAFPGFHLAIALDTKGPEVRTGTIAGDESKVAELKTGSFITITTDEAQKEQCSSELVYLDYKNFSRHAKPGQKIFVDDGLMNFEVLQNIGQWTWPFPACLKMCIFPADLHWQMSTA